MDPEDFQKQASQLLQKGTPVRSRSAVSRSYCAGFNVARALLKKDFYIPKDGSGHQTISRLLSWSLDLDVKEVASDLSDMRTLRNLADYNLDDTDIEDRQTAQAHVSNMGRHIVTLKEKLAGPEGGKILADIKAENARITGPPK